jgi:uncharacterized membrane-anchored protein YitT (DUF2179 family)
VIYGILFLFDAVSVVILSVMIFFGFALMALISSFFLRRIFLPYLPKEEEEEE